MLTLSAISYLRGVSETATCTIDACYNVTVDFYRSNNENNMNLKFST